MMKKTLLIILVFCLFVSNVSFAQVVSTLPGRNGPGIGISQSLNQWFFEQKKVSQPYTQSQCLANNGVYVNTRMYLPGDIDDNGRKDLGDDYFLSDNLQIVGDSSSRKLYLILPTFGPYLGSQVHYYLPSSSPDMLTLRTNGTKNPLTSNNAWYRQSKVAPVNQWVRAVSSEPLLFEAPTTTNLSDRFFQVAYRLSYAGYRSKGTVLDNNYQTFPVQNSGDFSSNIVSWFLRPSYNDNNFAGPLRQSDYIQSNIPRITSSINRGPQVDHGLECINYHLSRCGDGYVDNSGQVPTNGSSTQAHVISDTGVNEQCDPGANLNSSADDVLPSGAPAGSMCSASCTITTPAGPNVSIQKFQSTSSSSITNIQNGSNPLVIQPTNSLRYRLRITNTGGPANNVLLTDDSDDDLSTCTYQGVSPSLTLSPSVAIGSSLADPFSLTIPVLPNGTFDIKVNCGLASTQGGTLFNNSFSLNVPGQGLLQSNEVVSRIAQTITPPSLTIDKQQRLYPNGTFDGIGLNTPSTISYTSPSQFEFKIIVTNNGGSTANSVVMTDTLPVGFVMSSCSGLVGSTNIACNAQAGTSLTSQSFTLPANQSAVFTVRGMLTSESTTNNTAYATYSYNNNNNVTVIDSVNQSPQAVVNPDPVFSLTKEVKNVSTNGSFYQADDINSAISASNGQQVQYKLTVVKTSGGPITQNLRIQDIFPVSGLTISSMSVNGVALSLPANPADFDITLNSSHFFSANTATVLINATVGSTAMPGSYNNMSYLYYGTQAIPVDAGTDNAAWVGGAGVPQINIDKTYQEGSQSLDTITRNPGQSFIMNLKVSNNGSASSSQFYIKDQCDPRITCNSRSIPGTNFSGTIVNNILQTSNIALAYGSLGLIPGASITLHVYGTVNQSAEGTTVPNTAYLYDAPGFVTPIDNDSAEIISPIIQKSFSIVKSVVGTLAPGNTLTYTLRICNTGQGNITNYVLKDPLPTGLSYIINTSTFNTTPVSNPTILANTLTRGCGTSPNNLGQSCLLSAGSCANVSFSTTVNNLITP